MSDAIAYSPPTPATFRAARYWIARNIRGQSITDANASADFETELWLAERDEASAADLLSVVAADVARRQSA